MVSDNDLRNGIIQALVGESSLATLNNSKLLEVDIVRSVTASGFRSDHRIIETKINRAIENRVTTKPCLDRVYQKTFMNELVKHLPSKSHPLSTREQIVSYISRLIQALRETIRLVAPRIEFGFQRKQQTILEKQLNDRMSRLTSLQEVPTITPAIQERIQQL
ncbi:hypothetical protein NW758_006648 [Fusarium oxysporum]|nr:hypothetical protein NW758_006648 [Fusarium oxysporum]